MSDLSEFMDGLQRICKHHNVCTYCPMNRWCALGFDTIAANYEQMEDTIKHWLKEHPKKTRQSEFLKIYPHVKRFDGIININPCVIENGYRPNGDECMASCVECRKEYWLGEVEK